MNIHVTMREKFTMRHYQPEDYPVMAALANAVHIRLGDEPGVTAEQLARYFETPDFNRATDSFTLEASGHIAGVTDLEFSAASGRCWVDGMVNVDYWGQGIGTELIRLSEARCLEWAESALTPDQPISIQRFTVAHNTRAVRLFEKHGYQHLRTFYRMGIELNQPLDAPPLPGGLVLRSFDPERDARAVYEAHMDAFVDHWGFERDSYEEWDQQILRLPNNDFSLWLVAYDGGEIAGICLNRPYSKTDPEMVWVATLGVRRPWRKQGLGEALLRTSFARFQEKGYLRASLAVDSASPTNAVALYERAGMRVHKRTLVYRKMLRGEAPAEG